MKEPLLSVKNLRTYFFSKEKEIRAVDGIDLEVYPGQIVCVVGESGSGKSITSLSIMQLIPKPTGQIVSGEIMFDGKDLTKLSEKQIAAIRGNDISMIFQEPMTSLNPVLTIGDQISEVLLRHRSISKKKHYRRRLKCFNLLEYHARKRL